MKTRSFQLYPHLNRSRYCGVDIEDTIHCEKRWANVTSGRMNLGFDSMFQSIMVVIQRRAPPAETLYVNPTRSSTIILLEYWHNQLTLYNSMIAVNWKDTLWNVRINRTTVSVLRPMASVPVWPPRAAVPFFLPAAPKVASAFVSKLGRFRLDHHQVEFGDFQYLCSRKAVWHTFHRDSCHAINSTRLSGPCCFCCRKKEWECCLEKRS